MILDNWTGQKELLELRPAPSQTPANIGTS